MGGCCFDKAMCNSTPILQDPSEEGTSLRNTQSKILSKRHLSAARSLWQARSKLLSKRHLSAARTLWQARSKILSKRHLSAARSFWQPVRQDVGGIPNGVSIPILKVGMLSSALKDLEAKRVVSIPTFYPMLSFKSLERIFL